MSMQTIFKACDIRGVYPGEINEATACAVARGVGTVLESGRVVVGADVRPSSAALKDAAIHGLTESGADVIDLGVLPTPLFYFAKAWLGAAGGIMITASHNPARFNGMKIALGDLPITQQQLSQVRLIAENGDFKAGEGSTEHFDAFPAYRDFILSGAKELLPQGMRPMRVTLDCGNGCYSDIAPGILREIGFEVIEVFCEPDGTFPNREPNSAVAENLTALRQTTRCKGADFGVAFDGDGDRVAFTDEQGVVIPADAVMALLIRMLLKDRPHERVVYDIKSSMLVPEMVERFGGQPLIEKSGHTFLKTRMIRENAIFGGEISGHYFHRALGGGDDGLYSTLMMAALVAAHDCPISQRVNRLPHYATTPEIRLPFDGDQNVIERIAQAFPPERVTRLDGVRVDFEDGWALVRPSVTEPMMTLRFEAREPERLAEMAREFLAPAPELAEQVVVAASDVAVWTQ